MKKYYRTAALALLFASCTPQHRLSRLIRHHPGLAGERIVYWHDTVHTGSISADTSFYRMNRNDTIFIDKGRLEVKYFASRDTVFISGKCRDTVIVKSVPVKVREVVVKPADSHTPTKGRLRMIAIGIGVGVVLSAGIILAGRG